LSKAEGIFRPVLTVMIPKKRLVLMRRLKESIAENQKLRRRAGRSLRRSKTGAKTKVL
jgi:hypothetical protein